MAGGELLTHELVVGGVGVGRVVDQQRGGDARHHRQRKEDGEVAAHQRRTQMAGGRIGVDPLPLRRGIEPCREVGIGWEDGMVDPVSVQDHLRVSLDADDRDIHLQQGVPVDISPAVHEDLLRRSLLAEVATPLIAVEEARSLLVRVEPLDGLRGEHPGDLGRLRGRADPQEGDAQSQGDEQRDQPCVQPATSPQRRPREPPEDRRHPPAKGGLRDDRRQEDGDDRPADRPDDEQEPDGPPRHQAEADQDQCVGGPQARAGRRRVPGPPR